MSVRTFVIWTCRCAGRFWDEQPRHHMTCADCGSLIRDVEVMPVREALSYGAESIKDSSRGY